MKELRYVFYLVLFVALIGCNFESRKESHKSTSFQKICIRYTDNTMDTIIIDSWSAKHLSLNHKYVLYSFGKVYANDVRTYEKCN